MTNVNTRCVLLLNASYEPHEIITIRNAVSLLMKGRVDVVDGIAAKLRTPSTIFEVPSIIRLKRYVNAPKRKVNWGRRAVLKRDNYTCIFCGAHPGMKRNGITLKKSDFTLEHLKPISKGGLDTWSNTACACWLCNNRKGNRTPNEAGMKLLYEPKRPRVDYLVASGEIPSEWKIYIETS